jgi:ketosteroid isomerase-like protein
VRASHNPLDITLACALIGKELPSEVKSDSHHSSRFGLRLSWIQAILSRYLRYVPKFISDWAEDATFIYPPAVSVGGKTEGKRAIEKWFEKFVEQFPKVNFKVKNVCVENIFDVTGTNVAVAEWDITYTNRDGKEFTNTGVTVIKGRKGKAVWVCDYYFDTDTLKKAWGESEG